MTSQPLHTFGEGKSYTTFACSDVSVNKEENGAAVSFTVENTGAMAGTSVPCLYVRKRSGGVVARIKELKAFTRISLAPGEKKRSFVPAFQRGDELCPDSGKTGSDLP